MSPIIGYQIYAGISYFLNILEFLLAAWMVLSWVMRPDNQLYAFLSRIVAPVVAPFRGIAERLFMRGLRFDISGLLAIFALRILRQLILQLFMYLGWL